MTEDTDTFISMQTLPTELLYNIFFYLPATDLMKCRQVCRRWKLIIDGLANSDGLWAKYCEQEFNSYYWIAKRKTTPAFSWCNLYRSLSLWPRLGSAVEETDEFASASRLSDEIRSIQVLYNGTLSVHKKGGINYYDIHTLKHCTRRSITGDYARCSENDTVLVIQNYHLHLFVIRKVLKNALDTPNYTFYNVKMFLLTETELYYVKLNDEIYVCNLYKEPITDTFIRRAEELDGVMALGFKDGYLNVLTYQRNIFTVENGNMVFKQSLNSEPNLLNALDKYNFLEQLDWRVYFQWMYVLQHTVPQGPMRDIIVIRPYGDIYFVGSNYGVLCIFYKPFNNGELDLFNSVPVKQVNFMERSDIPVLATCPILQIDVLETENGHTVFVAMPKKVAVLKYTHTFMRPASWAILPYDEVQRIQFLNLDNIS